MVDDGSPDGTADRVSAMKDPAVVLLRRGEKGLVTALNQGIAKARGDVVLWMDADFSHPPEIAGKLVRRVRSGACDVALATRFAPNGLKSSNPAGTVFQKIQETGSPFLNGLLHRWLSTACSDWTSGFAALRKEILKDVFLHGYYGEYFISMMGQLILTGVRIEEIPYVSPPRRSGRSKTATSLKRIFRLAWYYVRAALATKRKIRGRTRDNKTKA